MNLKIDLQTENLREIDLKYTLQEFYDIVLHN